MSGPKRATWVVGPIEMIHAAVRSAFFFARTAVSTLLMSQWFTSILRFQTVLSISEQTIPIILTGLLDGEPRRTRRKRLYLKFQTDPLPVKKAFTCKKKMS